MNENTPYLNATAIVTGVSKGFGAAVARSLLAAGWNVVGDARSRDVLQATVASLNAGGRLTGVVGDINDDRHLSTLVARASDIGPLQLVVNSAGSLGPSPLPQLTDLHSSDLLELFETNVVAPLRLIQIVLPLIQQSGGCIINVTSDAAVEDYEGWGAYGASKAGLEKLTAVLRKENPDVRIYTLDPGDMLTDMHQRAFPGQDISDRPAPDQSAPAVLRLVTGDYAPGRYRASDLLVGPQR